MSLAGPSRPRPTRGPDTWVPKRYLEPLHPDNEEVLEQAAYQAAVTKHGGDNRKSRYKPRKTVDWQGGVLKWRQLSRTRGVGDWLPAIHPNPSDLIGVSEGIQLISGQRKGFESSGTLLLVTFK